MMVYSITTELNNPYQMMAALPNPFDDKMNEEQKQIVASIVGTTIKSVDLSAGEDQIIFTTDNN